jgi:hypothetical protein
MPHWPRLGFELTTSVVICTDCIGSCKSNYHTITATTAPWCMVLKILVNWRTMKSTISVNNLTKSWHYWRKCLISETAEPMKPKLYISGHWMFLFLVCNCVCAFLCQSENQCDGYYWSNLIYALWEKGCRGFQ